MNLANAIANVLRPLVRVLIWRGVRFPEVSDWLKAEYVAVGVHDFRLEDKRVTDSRLHVLTGLQRKDIKALRSRAVPQPASAGPVARVMALWLADISDGGERRLMRLGPAPSFESLVGRVSRDFHPRTVQDELVRQGLAELDNDAIRLVADAYVPAGDDTALMTYLGTNLGDHAEAAAANLMADTAPFFERAVHYNHLTVDSVRTLDALSRDVMGAALAQINARAAALQAQDRGDADATERFRCGGYIYHAGQEKDL